MKPEQLKALYLPISDDVMKRAVDEWLCSDTVDRDAMNRLMMELQRVTRAQYNLARGLRLALETLKQYNNNLRIGQIEAVLEDWPDETHTGSDGNGKPKE